MSTNDEGQSVSPNDAKPLVISRQSLIDALGKICGGKYFFVGYCNGSSDFALSAEKSEEDLADEIIEAVSDGL